MKIQEFTAQVTMKEGGKSSMTVAQVSEVLKIVNGMLWGVPYLLIRLKRKKLGNKGEIATLTVLAIAAVALLVGTLAPTLNPFNSVFGKGAQPDASKQTASWTKQTEIQTPVLLETKSGDHAAVGTKVERVYDTGAEARPVKLTFGERIGAFFAHLTTWGVVFVIVSLVFFGGAPLVWLSKKYFDMKGAFKNTVAAIREVDHDTYEKLKPKLEAKHDKKDRKMVDKIKSELN